MDELALALARRRARLEAESNDGTSAPISQASAPVTPPVVTQPTKETSSSKENIKKPLPTPQNIPSTKPLLPNVPPTTNFTSTVTTPQSPTSETESAPVSKRGSISDRIKLLQEGLKGQDLPVAPMRSQSVPLPSANHTTHASTSLPVTPASAPPVLPPKESKPESTSNTAPDEKKTSNAVYEKLLQNRKAMGMRAGGIGIPVLPKKSNMPHFEEEPAEEAQQEDNNDPPSLPVKPQIPPEKPAANIVTPLIKGKPPPLPTKPNISPPSKNPPAEQGSSPALNMREILEKKLAEGILGGTHPPFTKPSTPPTHHKPELPQAPPKPNSLTNTTHSEDESKKELPQTTTTSSSPPQHKEPTPNRSSIAQKGLNLEAILQGQLKRNSIGAGFADSKPAPISTKSTPPPQPPKELKPALQKIRIDAGDFIKREPQPNPQPLDRDTSEIDQMLQDRLTGKIKPPPLRAKPQLYLTTESKVKPPQPRDVFSTMPLLPSDQSQPLKNANFNGLTETQRNDLIQSFSVFDHDGDGLLDAEDIAQLRDSMFISEEELPDTSLTFAEYVERMKELVYVSQESLGGIKESMAPFVSSNKINCEELKEHLLSLVASESIDLDSESIEMFFATFSSQMDLNEFVSKLST